MSKRVLITGASGLLGRAVIKTFITDGTWEVTGLAFSRASGNLLKVDLNDGDAVKKVFEDTKPNVVIHCAAERRPDIVEHKTEEAWKLNVSATERLCLEAVCHGAWVLYISTDYVFDGKKAPYQVEDKPNPLNKYGRSKLEGEEISQKVSQDFGILRVPILYGEVCRLDESAVTVLFEKVQETEKTCIMSDYQKRFPTHCKDVAQVILQIAQRQLKDSSIKGIYHWSGNEEMTKYGMSVAMATVFGLPTGHIQGDADQSGDTIRPYNCQMDCSRLEALGIGQRSDFKKEIKTVLQPFFTKK